MIGDALPRATRDGTSPTGLSGSRGEPQGVGATSSGGSYSERLCFVYTRYKVPGPMGRSREALRGVTTVRKILTHSILSPVITG